MTFKDRIISYVGAFTDNSLDSQLSQWLTTGARIVVSVLPDSIMNKYATPVTIPPTAGMNVANYRILSVEINGYPAKEISLTNRGFALDSNSIHYATLKSPVYYLQDGKIKLLPNVTGQMACIVNPVVNHSDETIVRFPAEKDHAVVLYASVQASIYKAGESLRTLSTLQMDQVTAPEPPGNPQFTYVSATTGTVTVAAPTPLENAPVYLTPSHAVNFTNTSNFITGEEDIELAITELKAQEVKLGLYQADMQNRLNDFQRTLQIYLQENENHFKNLENSLAAALDNMKRSTEISIVNQGKSLERQIMEYRGRIDLFQSQVAEYGAEVNATVQKFQATIAKQTSELQMYTKLTETLKAEFIEAIR